MRRDPAVTIDTIHYRRLNYDGIPLIPVQDGTESYPYQRAEYADSWHVPGRNIQTTKELIALANSRGVVVTLTESSGAGRSTFRLN